MLQCLIPFVELAVLILLAFKYPDYAMDVFHCAIRYTTFRPCDISFHDKARATLVSILMRYHLGFARFAHRRFELISVVSTILFVIFLMNLIWGLALCFAMMFGL